MPTRNHKGERPATFSDRIGSGCESSTLLSDAAEKAKQGAGFVGEKVEQAAEAIGAGMETLGGAIREHEPSEGVLHNVGDAVAGKLERSGQYLEQHGLKGVGEDITNLIRRNPVPALLLGVGVGFLLAQMLRR